MKPNGRNLNLTSYDEIFQTEEARVEASQEKVIDIPLGSHIVVIPVKPKDELHVAKPKQKSTEPEL